MFGARNIIPSHEANFIADHLDLLAEHFPHLDHQLHLPSRAALGLAEQASEHDSDTVLNTVRSALHLDGWPFALHWYEAEHQGEFGFGGTGSSQQTGPAGLFASGSDPLIALSSDLIGRPVDLVATFCHEVGHYLLHERGLGYDDRNENELLTDLFVVASGFGIFQLRSSFRFAFLVDTQLTGHSWSRSGYLTKDQSAFALGYHLHRCGLSLQAIDDHVDQHELTLVKRALRFIRKRLHG